MAESRTELPLPATGAPPRPRVPEPERWRLANGLRVVAVRRPGLPQVAMRLVVPAGAAVDSPGEAGTAALVAGLLTEGSEATPPEALNARIDALGASLGAQVGHDFAEVDLVLLSETLGPGLDLLAEVVATPSFPESEIERARDETLDALEARRDEPANRADDEMALALFGPGHPYGRITAGDAESVAGAGRERLMSFHRRHYRPHGSVLVVAGDFETATLAELLERALGGWTGSAPDVEYPADPPVAHRAGERIVVPWKGAAQAEIRVGGLGMRRADPDWVPAAVANYLLGGSTITGRLGANLREDKGWTYGVRSGFSAALRPGGWVVETAVELEVAEAALAEIERELDRFLAGTVPEPELTRAKRALVLSLPRAFETPGRIVARFATLESYGLPMDYWERFPDRVESVAGEDVLRVARAHFAPERLARVLVGEPENRPAGRRQTS